MYKEEITKTILHLDADDIKAYFPDEEFKYEMYRDYRDEVSLDMLKKNMPDIDNFKKDGIINYKDFVFEWKLALENDILNNNYDYIQQDMERELIEKVKTYYKEHSILYDSIELDFYADDLYSIDLQLDYILNRSYVKWNLVWHNNYDGFMEGETKADGGALEQFLRLFPNAVKEEDLESACTEIYSGSDLKLNFKSTMKSFLDMLESGKANACGDAVLHLGVNGSGSSEFKCDAGEAKLDTPYESSYDYWTWEFDGHYGIESVYGPVGGAFNTY